jgi:ferric-dicitrate binding protein FerR (iron transport regulator)
MSPEEWDEFLAAYLEEGSVPESLRGREMTPAQSKELLDLLELEGLLARHTKPLQSEAFRQEVDRRIELDSTQSAFVRRVERRLPRRRLRWPLFVAAAAAAALVTWLWLFTPSTPEGKRIATVKGPVDVRAATQAEWRTVSGREDLYPGDSLRTQESPARVSYESGSILTLQPRTQIALGRGGGAPGVSMTQGEITVTTAPRDLGYFVQTPQAKIVDLGTRFGILAKPESTRLEVAQGRVEIASAEGGPPVEVKEGFFAVAAKGAALVVKPSAPVRGKSLVGGMRPGSWLAVPDSHLRRVVPAPATHEFLKKSGGPESIVASWSGGAFDTRRSRLVLWGGGVTNYSGNELYAFDVESLSWERLTEPSSRPADGLQVNPDGSPNGRATYGGLAYIGHADRFFALGGDLSRSSGKPMILADITWTFDFESMKWTDRKPSGDRPPTWVSNTCAYDPAGRRVWWGETNSRAPGLYSYDYDRNIWTRHNSDPFDRETSAVDTRRGLLMVVGKGRVFSYDLRAPNPVREDWKTTGGESFLSKEYPGLDYDPVSDRLVGWAGGDVYSLNPESRIWAAIGPTGAPLPTGNPTREYTTGIYGRWRYVPAVDAFILVTSIDEDVHFFRLPQ